MVVVDSFGAFEGHTYGEIASKLGFGRNNDDRSQVKYHLDEYREQRKKSSCCSRTGQKFSPTRRYCYKSRSIRNRAITCRGRE